MSTGRNGKRRFKFRKGSKRSPYIAQLQVIVMSGDPSNRCKPYVTKTIMHYVKDKKRGLFHSTKLPNLEEMQEVDVPTTFVGSVPSQDDTSAFAPAYGLVGDTQKQGDQYASSR